MSDSEDELCALPNTCKKRSITFEREYTCIKRSFKNNVTGNKTQVKRRIIVSKTERKKPFKRRKLEKRIKNSNETNNNDINNNESYDNDTNNNVESYDNDINNTQNNIASYDNDTNAISYNNDRNNSKASYGNDTNATSYGNRRHINKEWFDQSNIRGRLLWVVCVFLFVFVSFCVACFAVSFCKMFFFFFFVFRVAPSRELQNIDSILQGLNLDAEKIESTKSYISALTGNSWAYYINGEAIAFADLDYLTQSINVCCEIACFFNNFVRICGGFFNIYFVLFLPAKLAHNPFLVCCFFIIHRIMVNGQLHRK